MASHLNAECQPGACFDGFIGGDRQDVLELLLHRLDIRIRKINLVDDRNNGKALLEGQMNVGHRLRLDALSGIHDQQRASQAARLRRPS